MLTKEYLDSDRINFLIWRYLLEGDYRETAAKFQKEWQRPAPHREFPWAPHVNSQALVQIIQRGLLYHALQREHLLIQVSKSGREALGAEADALQRGIFGPLGAQDHQPRRHHHRHEQEEQQRPRPRQRQQPQQQQEQQQQQPPPQPQQPRPQQTIDAVDDEQADAEVKRPRLDDGSENGTAEAAAAAESVAAAAATAAPAAAGGTSPMDIDADPIASSQSHPRSTETSQAYPFPLEEAQPAPPVPIPISVHTQGPDKGTQLDKVEELAANTTFLQLTPNPLSSPVSPLQTNGGSPPVILHCQWNPTDPSCLAGAGTDSMARIWTVAHTRAASSATASSGPGPGLEPEAGNDQEPQQPGIGSRMVDGAVVTSAYCSLTMPDSMATDSVVTAMAWNWDGSAIAVATDHNTTAAVTIWSSSGEPLNQVEFAEPPVIVLRWSPNSTALLTIAPDKGGAAVTIFSGDDLGQVSYVLPRYNLLAQTPLDASWINETEFLLCGGDTLLSLRVTPTKVELIRRFDTSGTDNFVRVLYDHRSKIAATTSDQGTLDLWDENSRRRTIYAHAGEITAAQWQPLQTSTPEKTRLIATGGDDHMILIWNGRIPEAKPMCRLKMGGPVLALAFTPDGAFIAGATARQVLIWKVGDYFMPRASWTRPPQPGWLTPRASITAAQENDVYTLGWDSTGQKLAYGGNNRLAVMRFR